MKQAIIQNVRSHITDMSKQTVKRKSLFNKYLNSWKIAKELLNLKFPSEHYQDGYLCPICFHIFPYSETTINDLLTIEDIPPKSLGGKGIILTCKNCNNMSGEKIDSHLHQDERMRNIIKSGGDISLNVLSIVDKKFTFPSKLSFPKKDLFKFQINPKKSKTAQWGIDHLKEKWAGTHINFQFKGPNPYRVDLAKLRIAYLTVFATIGYIGILTSTYDNIRKQLLNPTEKILDGKWSLKIDQNLDEGLYWITLGDSLKAYMVSYTLKISGITNKYYTLVPSPTDESLKVFNYVEGTKREKFQYLNLSGIDPINDKKVAESILKLIYQ